MPQDVHASPICESTATKNEYTNSRIVDIHRGTGRRSHIIYAVLRSENGELLISATLEYIVKALAERLPKDT